MNSESKCDCGQCCRHPELPEFLFTFGRLTSVGLKDMKGQGHADYDKERAGHFKPKLMKRPDNTSKHLFKFASHER